MAEDTAFRESPCQTHVEWDIRNFLDLPKDNDYYLKSPSFSLSLVKWFLRIYPNMCNLTNSYSGIAMSLTRQYVATKYSIACRIGVKKSDGSELKSLETVHTFEVGESEWHVTITKKSTLMSFKDDLLPQGCLTIFCTARIVNKVQLGSQLPSPDGTGILIEQLKDLYLNRRFTDITILIKTKEFFAHKSILAARSPVFDSMLQHDMSEKNSGVIEISDCDPDSFEQFLLFLYTGKFDTITSSNVASLYETADKYDVKELRIECADFMLRELTVDSFCDVIHLAAMHNEKDLLDAATKFFIDNAETILPTTTWQSFIQENPLISNELFFKVIKSKKIRKN